MRLITLLMAIIFTQNAFADAIYGSWATMTTKDEFTGVKTCSFLSFSKNSANENVILVFNAGHVLSDDAGNKKEAIGAFVSGSRRVVLNSSDDALVLVDGEKLIFGSPAFYDSADKGSEITIRVTDNLNKTHTQKFSLDGFGEARAAANTDCGIKL